LRVWGSHGRRQLLHQDVLKKGGDKICSDLRLVGERMNLQTITSPELPSRQCLWQLNLRCLQFKGSYWCRHVPGRFTKSFSRQIDLEIDNITLLATGVDNRNPSLSSFTKERIRLPMNLKGLGVRDLEARRASEVLEVWSKAFPCCLIDMIRMDYWFTEDSSQIESLIGSDHHCLTRKR